MLLREYYPFEIVGKFPSSGQIPVIQSAFTGHRGFTFRHPHPPPPRSSRRATGAQHVSLDPSKGPRFNPKSTSLFKLQRATMRCPGFTHGSKDSVLCSEMNWFLVQYQAIRFSAEQLYNKHFGPFRKGLQLVSLHANLIYSCIHIHVLSSMKKKH